MGIVDTSKWNGQGPQPGTINGFGQTTAMQQNHQYQQQQQVQDQTNSSYMIIKQITTSVDTNTTNNNQIGFHRVTLFLYQHTV